MKSKYALWGLFLASSCCILSCQSQSSSSSHASDESTLAVLPAEVAMAEKDQVPKAVVPSFPLDTSFHFPWLSAYQAEDLLVNQIPVPEGFTRIAQPAGSFGTWLRHLPLKASGTAVQLYNGQLKGNQQAHARVVDIDVGKRDLQQCADAVMRLKAEYHFGRGEFSEIHFNFTSGDRVSFDDWRRGRKPSIVGNKVSFSESGSTIDNSYSNFKRYLRQIFSYAGTASLSKELRAIDRKEMQIGDVFIQGGFPGHALIVLDMAENATGQKIFLIAQSYMPAQDIHILQNHAASQLNPWYPLD
ncbi:MAG: DUF4846 domain-containing protein, partial [Bacteroidota bacterium]